MLAFDPQKKAAGGDPVEEDRGERDQKVKAVMRQCFLNTATLCGVGSADASIFQGIARGTQCG